MDVINFIKELFLTVMILFSMLTAPQSGTAYTAKNPDDVKLAVSVVADVHVETNNSASYTNLQNVLGGIMDYKANDATVFVGDNTMNCQEFENMLFFSAVNATVDSKNTFVALGNHDVGNGEGDYNRFYKRFKRYNNLMLQNKIDKPYYSRTVNGYTMVFLASENNTVNKFYMSDEQIAWFASVIDEAAKSSNPVFVFNHHPLFYIENENSDIVFDMCSELDNVIFVNGHTHGLYTVYEHKGITCVNLPRVTETVDYSPGTGVIIEVYGDEILLRERDFCGGEWLTETAIPLK